MAQFNRSGKKPWGLSQRMSFFLVSGALVLIGVLQGWTPRTFAQSSAISSSAIGGPTVLSLTQEDSNGDGRPDLTSIECACVTERDRVLVYDGGGDMTASDDWEQATDFRNDTWVYDIGVDRQAELIVAFSVEGQSHQALLYGDMNGDGKVSYEVPQAALRITERGPRAGAHPLWRTKVVADGPWLRPDGLLNEALHFWYDGPSGFERSYGVPDWFLAQYTTDGAPEREGFIVDANNDGTPEYWVSNFIADTPATWPLVVTYMQANGGLKGPPPPDRRLLWPLLRTDVYAELSEYVLDYFDTPPMIAVDWATGGFDIPSFPGYPVEHGYHTSSTTRFRHGEITDASFENRMAWFDLAEDHDGLPEQFIRLRHDPAHLANGVVPDPPVPTNFVAFAWNQYNWGDLQWDFQVNVSGRHELTGTEQIGDFTIRTIPYKDLPNWVTGQPWDYMTFVAPESATRIVSEGIGEWKSLEEVWIDRAKRQWEPESVLGLPEYLLGQSTESPKRFYRDIGIGLRGEYSFEFQRPVELYLNAIDHKLHVVGSQGGRWSLDEEKWITYADENGDGYLDRWTLQDAGQTSSDLWIAGDTLVLSNSAENWVSFHALPKDFALASSRHLPPTNKASWQALGAQLNFDPPTWEPWDFGAMAGQFGGPESYVAGVEASAFRPTSDGFRLVLDLLQGFQVSSDANRLGLDGLAAGEYLVENQGGAFTVTPLTPAQLSVRVRLSEAADVVDPAQVTIHNTGSADATGLTLVAEAAASDGAAIELARRSVDALAGGEVQVLVSLPSNATTSGVLRVRLEDREGQVVAISDPLSPGAPPAIASDAVFGIVRAPVLLPVLGLFAALLALSALLAVARRRDESPS